MILVVNDSVNDRDSNASILAFSSLVGYEDEDFPEMH